MRVLVATNHLEGIGGTEVYTYSLINELLRRGFDVEYFAFRKGTTSERIEKMGAKFYSGKKSYDLILGNHNPVIRFLWKRGFIIQTIHGLFHDLEKPSEYADCYVSVSEEIHDQLLTKNIASKIILNGIDCNRFKPQKPINEIIKNVLSLSHSNEANETIKIACDNLGITFHSINKYNVGEGVWNIENVINDFDLVFGLGRSAYDAMACGRPVIVFDKRFYSKNYADGYLPEVLFNSIKCNCSGRFYKYSYGVEDIKNEILKYNYADGIIMRKFALENLNIKTQVDNYLDYAIICQNRKFLKKPLKYFVEKIANRLFNLS